MVAIIFSPTVDPFKQLYNIYVVEMNHCFLIIKGEKQIFIGQKLNTKVADCVGNPLFIVL